MVNGSEIGRNPDMADADELRGVAQQVVRVLDHVAADLEESGLGSQAVLCRSAARALVTVQAIA